MTFMATLKHKNPIPGVMEFTILVNHYRYYDCSLSELCLEEEKQIFKEIMHFHYMTYMATP